MEYASIEAALGMIVFGPGTDTLDGIQYAAARLRAAATLLEYRYAIERRYNESTQVAGLGPITGPGAVDGAAMQQAPAAKRKRNRGRPRNAAANGATEPTPPTPEPPLFGQPLAEPGP